MSNYYNNERTNRGTGRYTYLCVIFILILYTAVGFGTDFVKCISYRAHTEGVVTETLHREPRTIKTSKGKRKKPTNNNKSDISFTVNGKSYTCTTPWMKKAMTKDSKETVYYKESDPTKCYSEAYMDEQKQDYTLNAVIFIVLAVLMFIAGRKSDRN